MMGGMGITGRHGKQTGKTTAGHTKHVPNHGGPQTGTGRYAQGEKPHRADLNIPGVTGKAAKLSIRILRVMRGKG